VTIRWLLGGLLTVTLGLSGCSDDAGCTGSTYQPDLDSTGEGSPIAALETWLGTDSDLADPPDDDWIQVDAGEADPARVVLKNDTGDGWWVVVRKTSQDGWVVSEATDDATACGDDLSG
jgi:hypothetical protein